MRFVIANREKSIDAYRFIAFMCVILVHIYPPDIVMQVTYFNVPAMVFVSGLCSAKSYDCGYWNFVWHRIKRILIPMYIFILPGYLLPLLIAQYFDIIRAGLNIGNILGSFFFWKSGMGYIWIFKVFILLAIVTPVIIRLNNKIKSNVFFVGIVVMSIVVQHILIYITDYLPITTFAYDIMTIYILYIIGYAPFLMIGIRMNTWWRNIKPLKLIIFTIILMIVGLCFYIIFVGLPIDLSGYKYPPSSYYYVYGGAVSLLLWQCKKLLHMISKINLLVFIGQNTNWFYLWHIPVVTMLNIVFPNYVLFKFIALIAITTTILYIQHHVIAKADISIIKYFKG